ncbi:Shedu immune nuclease family protein [Bradyrhizobium oligotrophicum]|uniref:Shedu immune nuclease family protein n=1 Tax=Bradyrhizobium oligotrophicum TaxID=44255 RepID=UPI003EBA7680
MSTEPSPRDIFFGRRTDKAIYSKRFRDVLSGQTLRIVSRVLDGKEGLQFATVGQEIVLRITNGGRFQIKATVVEDDRHIKTLTLQRYSQKRPLEQSFSFVGPEIDTLLEFVAGIRTVPLTSEGKVHISDDALKEIVLNRAQAQDLFAKHETLFLEIAQSEELKRDIVAIGYRRNQLGRFEALLSDGKYFAEEQSRLGTTPEGVWQKFFEANTWIFGYGLSFQFVSSLDMRKLELVVRGADVTGPGKRVDALMKTRGLINSLCFVEIKRHDKALLSEHQHRPGVWGPSQYLSNAVSQVQATVQDAIENIGRKLHPSDEFGDPTGEVLFNIQPRSCLIVGHLSELRAEHGVNENKFRSFELYRRNIIRPEILTFDELLERARFIVSDGATVASDAADDDVPF